MASSQALFQISFSLEGELVIDRVLRGIEERARDMRPVWPEVVKVFQTIVGKAFATEGASTGAPWAPLAPSTQSERRRQGFPAAHPILKRTGKLERALTIGEGAFVSTTASGLRYILGRDVDYFTYHQSTAPRTKLPRRAPVLLTGDDKTALVHPVRLYLTGRDAPGRGNRARIG